MTRIIDYTIAGRQQLSLDDLLAVIAEEEAEPIEGLVIQDPGRNGHDCEVEAICHTGHGIQSQAYICGWRGVGTVLHCPRRRRLMGGE